MRPKESKSYYNLRFKIQSYGRKTWTIWTIKKIIERKQAIVNSPIRRIPEEALQKVGLAFHQRNPKSLANFKQMQEVIPGGLQHNLGSTHPFALFLQ